MPSLVEDYIPWKIHEMVAAALEGITQADGYNTTPRVTDVYDEASTSSAKYTLYHEVEDTVPDEHGIGGGTGPLVHVGLEVIVYGMCRVETESPRRLAMALEQDVRNALHATAASMKDTLGRGGYIRFGVSSHDGGALADKKQSGFRFVMMYHYSQKRDW